MLRLTQQEIADLLGISRNYVSLLETEARNPTMSVVDAFEASVQPKLEDLKRNATMGENKEPLEKSCAQCHLKDKRIAQLEEQLYLALASLDRVTRQLDSNEGRK